MLTSVMLEVTPNPWDLTDVPQGLNNVLFGGSNPLGAQIILTIAICMCFLLPALIAKAKPDIIIILVIFAILGTTALGWLDPILGTMMCLFIALFYASAIRKMVTG